MGCLGAAAAFLCFHAPAGGLPSSNKTACLTAHHISFSVSLCLSTNMSLMAKKEKERRG